MNKRELFKRYILLIIALFFMGLGIAFAKRAELGVTPISSVPNVISYKFTFMTMGNWLTVWNMTMLLGQIVILRKSFRVIGFLQIPVCFLLGYFTDFWLYILNYIPADNYIVKLVMVFLGTAILGTGITLSFLANVVLNPGEAIVKVLAQALKKDVGNFKIFFDVSCVSLSIILSLWFFDFSIVGTREGTIIAAFGVGMAVKYTKKKLSGAVERILLK